MRFTLAVLVFGTSLTLAAERKQADVQDTTRQTVKVRTLPGANLFLRQTGECDIGYTTCGVGCMLSTSECCSDAGGIGSCPIGYYCDGTGAEAGCCETGKICSGLSNECTDRSKLCGSDCIPESETCDDFSSPSASSSSSASRSSAASSRTSSRLSPTATSGGGSISSCDSGEVECGSGCMPIGSTCCSDAGLGEYCNPGYSCVGTSRCRFGSGSSDSSSSSRTSSSAPLPTDNDSSSGGGSSSGNADSNPTSTEVFDGAATSVYLPGAALVGTVLLVGLIAIGL